MLIFQLACAMIFFGSPAYAAVRFPKIDIDAVCRKNASIAHDPIRAAADCMEVQNASRDHLLSRWSVMPGEVKSDCVKNSESYWSLENCINAQIGER